MPSFLCFANVQATLLKANKSEASKLTNDLMHGTFSVDYMASHSVVGGNPEKVAMSSMVLDRIICKFCIKFQQFGFCFI